MKKPLAPVVAAIGHEGLAHDLAVLAERQVARRQVLRWALGASLLPLVGCGGSSEDDPAGGSGATGGGGSDGGAGGSGGAGGAGSDGGAGGTRCVELPAETAGPFPGDGTNGPDVLSAAGVVRGDIRSSFGALSGTAAGVPLSVTLSLVGAGASCAPLAGYAVYLWHCDREGRYSLYSAGATEQNYLRGVQVADASGRVTFQTIFPGCYPGRWPHMHFEVFPSLQAAASAAGVVATSQLAFPEADCEAAYAAAGYEASVGYLAQLSLATDGVFRDDGAAQQVAATTGSVADGFTSALTVPVSV